MTSLCEAIRAELSKIYDPCSVAAGKPTSILDMGLVLGWDVVDGAVTLRLTVTNTGCTMFPHFGETARAAVEALDGVASCEVEVDLDHQWTPEQMRGPDPFKDRPRPTPPEPQAWRKRLLPA
ncbi:MAG: iron-sulfur cluster assembly protein [Oceanicaulis sp.]